MADRKRPAGALAARADEEEEAAFPRGGSRRPGAADAWQPRAGDKGGAHPRGPGPVKRRKGASAVVR